MLLYALCKIILFMLLASLLVLDAIGKLILKLFVSASYLFQSARFIINLGMYLFVFFYFVRETFV